MGCYNSSPDKGKKTQNINQIWSVKPNFLHLLGHTSTFNSEDASA